MKDCHIGSGRRGGFLDRETKHSIQIVWTFLMPFGTAPKLRALFMAVEINN